MPVFKGAAVDLEVRHIRHLRSFEIAPFAHAGALLGALIASQGKNPSPGRY